MGLVLVFIGMFIVGGFATMAAGSEFAGSLTNNVIKASVAVGMLFGIAFTAYTYQTTYSNNRVVTCTVTDKDRGADDGSYRVYTSDCGQLANKDSNLRWKRNSADLWQQIPEKGICEFRVSGVRWHWPTNFPNIFEVISCKPAA